MYRLVAALALVAVAIATGDPAGYACNVGSQLVSEQSCQNFRVPNLISEQINREFAAGYEYQAMASYFARDDVAWPGLSKLFYTMAEEERSHGQGLMNYMNQRGGRVELTPIAPPAQYKFNLWGPVEAMRHALAMEREMNDDLLDLHTAAEGDPHLQNHLEEELLVEQVNAISKLSFYVTQTERLKTDSHALTDWDSKLSGDPHHG